jgi:hypothetical protein
MSYSADENLYLISVESQVSIDYCLVHCDSKVDVLDVERNLAILSLTKTVLSVLLLATARSYLFFFNCCIRRMTPDYLNGTGQGPSSGHVPLPGQHDAAGRENWQPGKQRVPSSAALHFTQHQPAMCNQENI